MPVGNEMIGFYENEDSKYISTLRITGGGIWIREWSAKIRSGGVWISGLLAKIRKGVKADQYEKDWWESADPSIIDPSYRVRSYVVCAESRN